MPVEPSKAKLKRRSSRKEFDEYRFDSSHARELEQKRNRGEVSCAECRRLKIKCDKQIPCQSCQRRGCAALCPNGSLSTGQGTRFVLAATEHLHRRIAGLSGRIRQLEDALAALSPDPHPLLHADLLMQDDRDDDMGVGMGEDPQSAVQPDVIDAFGTLSISDHGISRFFGPTGGSESLLLANLPSSSTSPSPPPSTSTGSPLPMSSPPSTASPLALFSHAFPFTPLGPTASVQSLIESHLPSYARAHTLCHTYLDQVAWLFRGLTRGQLLEDLLPTLYRRAPAALGEGDDGPHALSLLFSVFAIAALVQGEDDGEGGDRTAGEDCVEANRRLGEHYHQVARAAAALQPVLEKPALVTVQTLHLMSVYNAMSGSDLRSETSMEMTWSLITLAAHLSQTIGLHRDSARWGLSPKMVQRRRILFWDLFVADVWQSLNTGRPPSFSLAYIDCSFPDAQDEGFGSAFGIWQFRFAAECVADVAARTLTAEAPTYATIMELDRKVREFPLPDGMSDPSKDGRKRGEKAKDDGRGKGVGDCGHKEGKGGIACSAQDAEDMAMSFQRCVLDHIRETVLMYIHRSFFAQAIIEHPENPLRSAYAPSFLAAYRASSTILKSVKEQFKVWPGSCARFWTMWTFAFSAAVVFGTVVTRGPRSPLAQSAMAELEQACILFSKAAVYSIRAAKALPILTKLSEKARTALAAAQIDPADHGGILWNIKQENTDDELSIFAGHTRFVSAQKSHSLSSVPVPAPLTVPVLGPAIESRSAMGPIQSAQPQRTHIMDSTLYPPHPQQSTQMVNSWAPPPPSVSEHRQRDGYGNRPNGYTDHRHREEFVDRNQNYGSQRENYSSQRESYGASQRDGYMSTSSADDRAQALHYPYVSAERTHQPELAPQYTAWAPGERPPVVPSQAQFSTRYYQQAHAHEYPAPQHLQQQQQQSYTPTPAFHAHAGGLADLGLAARDSRLDERWSSFMEDSGMLEGLDFGGNAR